MKKKYSNIILFFSLIVLSSGCNKLVDVGPKKNSLTAAAVFADSVTVNSALVALYSQGAAYNGSITYLNSLYADELTNTRYPQYQENSLTPTDPNLGTIWQESYNIIFKANAIIEGVQSSNTLSEKAKLQAAAEAKFFRAFCHFNLVNIFRNVPLITTTNADVSAKAAQTSSALVYQQIVSDLTAAISGLPETYALSGGSKVRINQVAARALLSRTYLYLKDYQNALTQSNLIISNSNYSILNNLNAVFLANSSEAIWQYDSQTNGFPEIARTFVPAQGAQPSFIISANLFRSFETNDLRKNAWIGTSGGFNYPAKYFALSGGSQFDVVLRLAEQYLIRAESRVYLSDINGAKADIDVIRKRAGLSNTTANNRDELLIAIEKERQTELFCEWGHRFFDLKRTERINTVMSEVKPGVWKPSAALYPIPAVEISKNVNLKQNPGYN